MRVLMTADAAGGVWTYALDLARALSDVDFVVATMGPFPSAEQRAAASLLPNVKLISSNYKLEWMDDPWENVTRAGAWLLDLETEYAPDVVHLNGYSHAAMPFVAPKIVVGHSCVLSWWSAVHGEPAPPSWDRYRQSVERGLHSADLVVAPSAWMLGELQRLYRFTTSSSLIYNGRYFPDASPRSSPRSAIFAAGRLWDQAKNISAVVEAAPRLQLPVRIAGDGDAASPNIEHLGVLDARAMADAYANAAIYLFPALYEPFGLSILEAALSGCALVLGDIPSLREIWGDAAIYVPPREADAIVDAVNDAIPRADALGRNARERAQRYGIGAMANAYRAVYRNLRTAQHEPHTATREALA